MGRRAGDEDARLLTWELILPDQESLYATKESLSHAGFAVSTTAHGLLATDPWGITIRLLSTSSGRSWTLRR